MTPGGKATRRRHGLPAHGGDETWATASYLSVIFLGPVVPLAVYLAARRRPKFLRRHAAQALNVALTCLLYSVSGAIVGGVLAIGNPTAALAIMTPLAAAGWLLAARQLVLAGAAASRGEYRQVPAWLCSTPTRQPPGSRLG